MPKFNVIHRPALSCFENGRRISFGQFDESWLKFSPVCVFSWSSCLLCAFVRFCVLLCASSNFPPIFLKTTRSQINQFYSFIQIKSSPESKWNVVTILLKEVNVLTILLQSINVETTKIFESYIFFVMLSPLQMFT